MSIGLIALVLAIAALFVGPAMVWLLRTPALRAALDGLCVVLVAGVALLHLGPHAVLHGGLVAVGGVALGLIASIAMHRLERKGAWASGAVVLLGAHAFLDGAALGILDGAMTVGLGLAVVVHRLPVGLAVVAAARPSRGALLLGGLAVLTVLGFTLGQGVVAVLPESLAAGMEGAIVGGMLHVVFAHRIADVAVEEEVETLQQEEPAFRLIGIASAGPALMPMGGAGHTCDHGHDHDHATCGHGSAAVDHEHHGCGHDHDHHPDACEHELHLGLGGHGHDHSHDHALTPDERRASAIGALLGVLILAGIAAAAGSVHELEPLRASVRAFITLTVTSAPALLLGFVLAGLVSAFLDPARLGWLAGGGRGSQAVRGVVFGLPLPVCSCGVVPMYQSLIRAGVPIAAGLAFLVATPELGFDAVLLSVPLLGMPLTVARVVAAFVVALLVAILVGGRSETVLEAATESAPVPARGAVVRLRQGLRYGLVDLVDHTLPWIGLGLVLAALAEPLFDHQLLAALPPALQVPLAAVIGIPLYVCASGATPLAAVAIHKGLSAGAALAFLLAGPATNVTTFGILSALHGRRLALRFGLILTVLAVVLGWSVDVLGITVPVMEHPDELHEHGLGWGGIVCAVAICGVAVASLWRQGVRQMLEQLINPIHAH